MYDYVLYFTERYRTLQNVTERYRTLQNVTERYRTLQNVTERYRTLQNVTERYRTLQNVAEFGHHLGRKQISNKYMRVSQPYTLPNSGMNHGQKQITTVVPHTHVHIHTYIHAHLQYAWDDQRCNCYFDRSCFSGSFKLRLYVHKHIHIHIHIHTYIHTYICLQYAWDDQRCNCYFDRSCFSGSFKRRPPAIHNTTSPKGINVAVKA
jgi:hypothetical protein